jgi:hypothetical protein
MLDLGGLAGRLGGRVARRVLGELVGEARRLEVDAEDREIDDLVVCQCAH